MQECITKRIDVSALLRTKYGHWDSAQKQACIDVLVMGNRFLRDQNVLNEHISQVLQFFEPGHMNLELAGETTYGLRRNVLSLGVIQSGLKKRNTPVYQIAIFVF